MSLLAISAVNITPFSLVELENLTFLIDFYRYYQQLTFQAIAVAAFGFDLDEVQREEPEFLAKSRAAFEISENKTPVLLLFLKLIGKSMDSRTCVL